MLRAGEEAEKQINKALKDHTIVKHKDREDETAEEGIEEDRKFSNVDDRISYRSIRAKINRKLFRAICSFLKRIDYFKGKTFEDEA